MIGWYTEARILHPQGFHSQIGWGFGLRFRHRRGAALQPAPGLCDGVFACRTNFAAAQFTSPDEPIWWHQISLHLFVTVPWASQRKCRCPWACRTEGGPDAQFVVIHAATMVTAGIFMVAVMSPVRAVADGVVFVLIIGSTTAFFMGLSASSPTTSKRVVGRTRRSQVRIHDGGSALSALRRGRDFPPL